MYWHEDIVAKTVNWNCGFTLSFTRNDHLFFLSSSALMRTGAAGILTHHSFTRLTHLSLLSFLYGISLVKNSRNTSRTMYLRGTNANAAAMKTSSRATLSVAWKWQNQIRIYNQAEASERNSYYDSCSNKKLKELLIWLCDV